MLTVLLVLGGIGLAALLGVVFVFSIQSNGVSYEVLLVLRDAAGQPLAQQSVAAWCPGYPLQELRTDAAGRATLRLSLLFTNSALIGPRRPDSFPVRLSFPGLSPLFYNFAVRRPGPVAYHVFNTDQDNVFGGQWVGDFDAAGRRARTSATAGSSSKVYAVVPSVGGQLLRWHADATLRRVPPVPNGSHRYALTLTLQQCLKDL